MVTFPEVGADHVSVVPLSPLDFLTRARAMYADKVAVVHGERRLTYAQLAERVARLADALRARGIGPRDRVAFLCPNTPAMLEAHFAVPAIGAVLVALNTRLAAAEIDAIVRRSGAALLVVDAELEHLAPTGPDAPPRLRVDDTGAPGDPYEDALAAASPAPPPRLPATLADEHGPLSINYTSGTTGDPKGVVYSHRGAYLNALSEALVTGLDQDSVYLWTLPMFHCNGWCFPWAVTAVAGTHVCLRRVEPARIWELVRSEGVTHLNGAPTVQIAITTHADAAPLERPVTVTVAGAPPSPTLLGRLQALGFRPVHVYGLTETYGPITSSPWLRAWEERPPEEQARLLARQGQGLPTSDLVRVVDDALEDVPRDGATLGEVVMRGSNVMSGYLDDPEATARAFAGGWFHSGDLAVMHPDGSIELRDRKKDIIISGGENISTIEVEQALARHPDVLECAVVGRPDDYWGERPVAFVTLVEGAATSAEELLAFCGEQLARYKRPAEIHFGALPKTSTGKVQKFALRERAREA